MKGSSQRAAASPATRRQGRFGRDRIGTAWRAHPVKLANGRTVVADRDYLIRSILEPDAQVVEGYAKGIMSAAIRPESIDRDDAEAMAAYIESLPAEP